MRDARGHYMKKARKGEGEGEGKREVTSYPHTHFGEHPPKAALIQKSKANCKEAAAGQAPPAAQYNL